MSLREPTTPRILSPSELATMVTDLVAAGTRVIAPVPAGNDPRRTEYRPIRSLEEAALRGPLPRRSLKELFLPPTEVLLRYRQRKDGVDLQEVPTAFPRQVILGARPCDAAGVETLDAVMGWDYRDELWFGRREATTIVSVACPGVDSTCFCDALGLGPDSTKGADALLVPLDAAPARPRSPVASQLREAVDGFLAATAPFPEAAQGGDGAEPEPGGAAGYLARAVTPRGEALLDGRGAPADPAQIEKAERFARAAREKVARNPLSGAPGAELALLPQWLAANFEHPLWKSLALRCHGCGACAAVCSTCHCFDIVDEHDAYDRGARRRNWDFCQSAKFTLHASGHNPRQRQTERLRQRVMHKFSNYPRRFDAFLCTGCGRCARACAAGMNLPEVLGQLVQLAGAEKQGSDR